jgi:hypothetical protein
VRNVTLLALLTASCGALGQQDGRDLGRDAVVAAQDSGERPQRDYKLHLGAAYTDAQSGERVWATPFYFRVRFNQRRTFIKLTGDGYVASRSDEGRRDGIANVNASLVQRLAEGLRGELGITVPTGGDAGSRRGRERLGLSYERTLSGPWTGLAGARLVRYDADPGPGESRIRRQGLLQLSYSFDASRLAFGQLERADRPGVSSATAAAVGYQWPVGRSAAGPTLAILTFARGLSRGAHDSTLELDFSFRF